MKLWHANIPASTDESLVSLEDGDASWGEEAVQMYLPGPLGAL